MKALTLFIITKTILALLLLLPIAAEASGERELKVSIETLDSLPELSIQEIKQDLNYLGSTDQWHLLGVTLTSTEGDMPFSSTYGFKVNTSSLAFENGWQLDLRSSEYIFSVNACPTVLMNALKQDIIILPESAQDKCMVNILAVR